MGTRANCDASRRRPIYNTSHLLQKPTGPVESSSVQQQYFCFVFVILTKKRFSRHYCVDCLVKSSPGYFVNKTLLILKFVYVSNWYSILTTRLVVKIRKLN